MNQSNDANVTAQEIDTATASQPHAPADDSALYRIIWRRENGEGNADTFHVVDSVLALDAESAQKQYSAAHLDMANNTAAVPQAIVDAALTEAMAEAQKRAEQERWDSKARGQMALEEAQQERDTQRADERVAESQQSAKEAEQMQAARQRLGGK